MNGFVKKDGDLQLALTIIISIFIHLIFIFCLTAPQYYNMAEADRLKKKLFKNDGSQRDIIVNINQDGKRVVVRETLLSDKDSSARGHVTRKKGDQWLNNSLDFQALRGNTGRGAGRDAASQGDRSRTLTSDESEMIVTLDKSAGGGEAGNGGVFDRTLIPDRHTFSKENALFYTNDGRFSYNTVKFRNFKFFKELKDKIASNWHPPIMANAIIEGYNPQTGGYAPGYTKISAIPSQQVALVFVLNKDGDIIYLELVDSMGNKYLDKSCLDAIRLSKTFGAVPEDLLQKDRVLVIPFVFIYYVH